MLTTRQRRGAHPRAQRNIAQARLAVKLARAAGKFARQKYDEYTSSRPTGGSGGGGGGANSGSGKGKRRMPSNTPRPKTRAARRNSFVGSTYAGLNNYASKVDIIDQKKPIKGNNKPQGTIVVSKCPKHRKLKQRRDYPKSLWQTYYLSDVNLDTNGNIGSLNRRYTNMSVSSRTATGFLMNLGTNCLLWDPSKYSIGNIELEAKGDATVDNANPFWKLNGTNTGLEQDPMMVRQTKMPETATPYQQGQFPAVLKYTVPNHVMAEVKLNLSFMSASICDQLVTITLLRNTSSEPTQPGNWSNVGTEGGISGADTIKLLCNDHANTTGKQYETLFKTTRYIKGINLNHKDPKVYYCNKDIKINYQRSTCRRVTSALDNSVLGGGWQPSFEIDQSGAMYSNLVLKVFTKCITNDKIVGNYKGAHSSAGTVDYYEIPKQVNMDAPQEYWQNCTYMKSRIRYGGTVALKSYVREYNRGLGGDVQTSIGGLQDQINELTSQVGALTAYGEEHVAELDEHIADEEAHHSCDSEPECESEPDCEQTVTAHEAGAPVATDHGHPNSLTAEEHRQTMGGCPHSH